MTGLSAADGGSPAPRERRVVAVFTSSRADLGPLWPVIEALDSHEDVDLLLLMSGTHFMPEWGGRGADIALQNGRIVRVDAALTDSTAEALGHSFAAVARGVSDALASTRVDCLVLLGDRWELLAVAGVALLHGVPLVHLHGGEVTEGAIDERIRHGLTKLADLHLCASEDSARRIRRLGEEPWRIVVTGAPGLDRVVRTVPMSDSRLEEVLGRVPARPLGVAVYHPTTVERHGVAANAAAVFRAASLVLKTTVVLRPGVDPGTDEVLASLAASVAQDGGNLVLIDNLGEEYLPLLATADVLIGNSSSGIIEAASLRLPVVNVGDRQAGRLRPPNVLDVPDGDEAAIATAISQSLNDRQRLLSAASDNPYGDGASSPRIVEAILSVPLDRLARKPLVEEPADLLIDDLPLVSEAASIRTAMEVMDRSGHQICLVTRAENVLIGTVSDGDIRRAFLRGDHMDESATRVMSRIPVVLTEGDSQRPDAILELMRRTGVSQVPVLDRGGRIVGLHVMRGYLQRRRVARSPGPMDPSEAQASDTRDESAQSR